MLKADPKWVSEKLKETGVFLGWIAGLFLVAGLTWFFTRPVRNRITVRHINSSLSATEEFRQLEAPLVFDKSIPRRKTNKAAQLGTWYSLSNSADRAVVFSIMNEGLLAPFVIFISPQGDLGQPIPLGAHAIQIRDRLPPGILRTYMNRIEAGEALLREKR